MSDELERALRTAFAERAAAPPPVDGLADAAIGGARRIRRRRRIAAAGGAFAVAVLGAASLVWAPWNLITDEHLDLPAASRTQAEIADLGLEVVVDDNGRLAVVDAFGDVTDLNLDTGAAYEVIGVGNTYVATGAEEYAIVVTTDDAVATENGDTHGWVATAVNDDRGQFALMIADDDAGVFGASLYDVDVLPDEQKVRQLELSSELSLRDWGADYLVVNADLDNLTTGWTAGDSYYLNESHDWGFETAAEAGFEVVLVYDYLNADFACVTDLDPETATVVGADTCDLVFSQTLGSALAEAAPGTEATLGYESEPALVEDAVMMDGIERADIVHIDPDGRWELHVPPDGSEWVLIEADGTESRFEPPAGALFPVMRYD